MGNLAREGAVSPKVKAIAERFQRPGDVDSWLRSVYRYRSEVDEIIRSPEFMLNDLQNLGYVEGDCDDIATLSAALTKAMGFPTRLTALQTTSPVEYDHVFSEARIGQFWLPIDPTVPRGTTYRAYGVMSEGV